MMKEESKERTWTIADLEALRSQIDAAIGILKQLEGSASGGSKTDGILNSLPSPPIENSRDNDHDVDIRSDAFFGLSFTDATYKYLQMIRRPQTTEAICEALQKGGIESKSQNFLITVYSSLRRDARRFVRVKKKEWGLVEWYPTRPQAGKTPKDEGIEKPTRKRKK
ncbi:MAG TPA: hypothetical protein VGB22_06390 [candidate division Zixibacteria bacterium]|jgi:hypothetical protein